MDKIELPLDLARALYKVYQVWMEGPLGTMGESSDIMEIPLSEYKAMESATADVELMLTMEQVSTLESDR